MICLSSISQNGSGLGWFFRDAARDAGIVYLFLKYIKGLIVTLSFEKFHVK
jgi:hypothetical protein